ncbi:uncharacterized protein N7482_001401 [Penicillium canariense]|uniref:Clr5 domain-containing protein n=1 Tax=Penicillium canariense TaxID=189055 RepID=A0A9W9IDB8_9EURO|nr:uncharacterized protein N7482_001401 [Penicillium canariense]KAJ5175524.1 hypothetical protein N7482_001401 [Penicillium canariense]
MKTSISSDVWEKKKALIAKLYMEEEWPLKQVIKQIRSDDFNPSETQLRSRLKKWRVTKPSRQTRKKPPGSEDPESEKDSQGSSSTSPQNSTSSPVMRNASSSTTRSSWPGHSLYAPADVPPSGKWNAPLAQRLTPSPSADHSLISERHPTSYSFSDPNPTTTSFEPSAQTSPVTEGLLHSTTSAATPTYAAYPLSPESCIPSPGSTTTPTMGQWPPRSVSVDLGLNPALHPAQWYGMPFEPMTPPPGVPHSTPLAPPPPPAGPAGYVVPSATDLFSPEYCSYDAPEYHGFDAKQWKRAMSLEYGFAGHHGRYGQHERKHIPHHAYPAPGMVPIPASQAGPHAVMCAPMVPYMG